MFYKTLMSRIGNDILPGLSILVAAFVLGQTIPKKALAEGVPKTEVTASKEASLQEITEASSTGSAVIIDTRSPKKFAEGNIPSSINLPLETLKTSEIEDLDKTKTYILYCSGPSCEDSRKMAIRLIGAGFSNVKHYLGGWEEWQMINGS